MNWADAVDHFAQGNLACRDEAVLVLVCDAVRVSGQHDQVALGFADEEGVFANGADCCGPDGLVVAADFLQLIFLAVHTWDIFDDADALHQIGYHDHVVDHGDVDGCGGSPVTGELFQFHWPGMVVNHLVDNDLVED